ncbi:MAG: hypothetical protein RLZZ15_2426 [Verrucomicrobiota bacterium]|jgi:FixJ family two-component response regulator
MNASPGTVYLLDDDPGIVKALSRLLRTEGFEARGYTEPAALLAEFCADELNCLLLDLSMPGMGGLEFQALLAQRGLRVPIVFLTGSGDIPTSVRAIKAGAVDFMTKPVGAEDLFRAVRLALAHAAEHRRAITDTAALAARFATLTPREQDVFRHVVAGKLNKQIAADLGTGEQNIKIHRGRVMVKLGVVSVADLVRAAERLGVAPAAADPRDSV